MPWLGKNILICETLCSPPQLNDAQGLSDGCEYYSWKQWAGLKPHNAFPHDRGGAQIYTGSEPSLQTSMEILEPKSGHGP